jgi:hypothetical protein
MKKLVALMGLQFFILSTAAFAQVSEDEIQLLRQQIEMLTNRLDALEKQNKQLAQSVAESSEQAVAKTEDVIDAKVDEAVTLQFSEKMAAVSWAERIRWSGDFRYRYENIDYAHKDDRNRSRIRARTHIEADLMPTLKVGVGLATGGDDPVSSNQTIGGGGSSKDIKLDLAYFNWSGLQDTNLIGGKMKNFLERPGKKGLQWDDDWRPEGLGGIWNNGKFFAQGLGTWLESDSNNGTTFAWIGAKTGNLTNPAFLSSVQRHRSPRQSGQIQGSRPLPTVQSLSWRPNEHQNRPFSGPLPGPDKAEHRL